MNRLLIVDDEKFTVDGLYEMIEDTPELELDLYRAYSPEEALEWLSRTKIDIVLSDVRMPGMTGLELQQRIIAQWPRCKIIFLTGIHNLETAQLAVRSGSIDYILKTEGDEAIIRSIRKAIDSLAEESQSSQFMLQAKERMSRALPLLHRDWVMSLLELQSSVTAAKLQELHIPLSSELPVIPLIGRVDQWQNTAGYQDQSLLLYAVQNIASEYYGSQSFFSVSLDMHHFICLVQPSTEAMAAVMKPEAEQWRDTLSFVQGTMLSVQQTCDRLLKLPVSLICGAGAVSWQQLPSIYGQMRKQLLVGLGSRDRMLLILDQQQAEGEEAAEQPQPALPPLRTMTTQLERLLELGDADEFAVTVKQYAALPTQYADYALVYYAVASVLLSQLTQGEARQADPGTNDTVNDIDIDTLMNLAAHKSREAALQFLLSTAATVYERRNSMQSERTNQLICKLHQFIRSNLGGDLSLTRLSEVVYLNPAYLSVLYKQQTGRNLSDYIAELRLDKAKELLLATPFKIHEIADKVGFETSGYFTRFFKKRLQMTPQEYRAKE